MISTVAVPTTTKAVWPTPTELDRWAPVATPLGRVSVENLDLAQSVDGWLESRPITGVGVFGAVGETAWTAITPLLLVDQLIPVSTKGTGELRFMASSSGAGCSVNYTRRWLSDT